jgi:very-short-patch-repair endonuclease
MNALFDLFAVLPLCHRNIKLALQVGPELFGWGPLLAVQEPSSACRHLLPLVRTNGRRPANSIAFARLLLQMGEGADRRKRALDRGLKTLITCSMANLTALARTRARSLRKAETQAEIKLWEALRARRLGDHKFVRQLSIGPYFADFVCRERKLIIEVDGATHGTESEIEHDEVRSEFLRLHGWRVHRVWNHDVFTNLVGVCDSILLRLAEPT